MGRLLLTLRVVSGFACKKNEVLSRAYVGTAQERGRVQVGTSPRGPDGRVNVQWWNTDRPRGNVRVTVTPVSGDDRRYRVALPGCTVEVQMDPEPNDRHGQLVMSPQPVCELDIDHYRGPMRVGGMVEVDQNTRALRVTVMGNNNQSSPHVEWSLAYDGRPE